MSSYSKSTSDDTRNSKHTSVSDQHAKVSDPMQGAEAMQAHGLRVTVPRQKILDVLQQAKGEHMTAEKIHQLLQQRTSDIGLATVYRALGQFVKAGLVIKHQFESGRAVYELDHGEHHDHMVCLRCGRVDEFVDEVIEQRQLQIAQQAGFELTDHQLNLFGLCVACRG